MSELARLAHRIQQLEQAVRVLGASPQLASSSIVDGAVTQTEVVATGTVDEFGSTVYAEQAVAVFGRQSDGSNTAVSLSGPKPPTPTGFTVTPGPGFVGVEWLGEFTERVEAYLDHDYVAVHVGVSAGFTPIADTVKATIRARQGERIVVPLEPGAYFVTLVAVSQSGTWGDPAPYEAGEPGSGASAVDVVAREMAQAAFDLADGKSRVYYSVALPEGTVTTDPAGVASVAPPAGVMYGDGDVWYHIGPAPARTLVDVLVYDATAGLWRAKLLADAALGSVSAAKITTGTLAAATSISIGPTPDGRVVIGDSALQVYRANPEGVPVPTIRVGGALGDNLVIMDPVSGATKAGFNTDGDGVARAFSVDTLTVGGRSVDSLLQSLPRGVVASYQASATRPAITTTQYGLFEVAGTLPQGRIYNAMFVGNFTASNAGNTMRLFLRSTADGSAPLITSPQLTMGWFPFAIASLPIQCRIGRYFHVGADPAGAPVPFRLLLSAQTLANTNTFYPDSGTTPGQFIIEDIGEMYEGFMLDGVANGGTVGDPVTPPPPVGTKTYTKIYGSAWTRCWQGGTGPGSVRTDTTDAVFGYYGGWQNYSQIGFPTDVYTDLNGSTVQKIELYLYVYHWYSSSGGTVLVGAHGNITAPASFTYSGSVASTGWPAGAYRWVTIPSSFYAGFESGANRGFTLGGGASTSSVYYGRAYGTGASSRKPAIRITYVK